MLFNWVYQCYRLSTETHLRFWQICLRRTRFLSAVDSLLEICWNALKPGGRLVANAVTLEGEQKLLQWQKDNSGNFAASGDLTRLAVSRVESIGKFQSWKEARSVTQLAVIKKY